MPKHFLFSPILTPHNSAPRGPVASWARRLDVALSDSETYHDIRRLTLALNNAALLAVLVGDATTARALCEVQIHSLAAHHARYDHREAIIAMYQPLLNLLRLRFRKDAGDALDHVENFPETFLVDLQIGTKAQADVMDVLSDPKIDEWIDEAITREIAVAIATGALAPIDVCEDAAPARTGASRFGRTAFARSMLTEATVHRCGIANARLTELHDVVFPVYFASGAAQLGAGDRVALNGYLLELLPHAAQNRSYAEIACVLLRHMDAAGEKAQCTDAHRALERCLIALGDEPLRYAFYTAFPHVSDAKARQTELAAHSAYLGFGKNQRVRRQVARRLDRFCEMASDHAPNAALDR